MFDLYRPEGQQMRRSVATLAVALVTGVLVAGVPQSPARAASTSTVVTSTIPMGSVKVVVAQLPPMSLVAGSHMYFHASYNATAHLRTSSDKILQAAQISCASTSWGGQSTFSTTNRYASRVTGSIAVYWLFTVPASDTYTCSLMGWAASTGNYSDDTLTVNAGSSTYLFMNDQPRDGSSWQDSVGSVDVSPGTYQYVLRQTWPAADTGAHASTISVVSGVEVTTNYLSSADTATVTVQLAVIQGGNAYCDEHYYTVGPVTISGYVHHFKFYVAANDVAVNPGCPNQWAIKTKVINASGGVRITVNASGYSDTFAYWG